MEKKCVRLSLLGVAGFTELFESLLCNGTQSTWVTVLVAQNADDAPGEGPGTSSAAVLTQVGSRRGLASGALGGAVLFGAALLFTGPDAHPLFLTHA